jgi:hypothetical protein
MNLIHTSVEVHGCLRDFSYKLSIFPFDKAPVEKGGEKQQDKLGEKG